MPSENPIDTIAGLLQREFNVDAISVAFSKTEDIGPVIHETNRKPPYVSVSSKSESVVNGGETNVTGFAGDGSGHVQVNLGTVLVECNGGHKDTAGTAQTVAHELAQEASRVLRDADVEGELHILAPTAPEETPKTKREPPEYAEQLFATYDYEAR